jgi:hypothetical protein
MSELVSEEKVKRVQMDLSPNSFERLKRIKGLTEAGSYTEVMKDALRLYEFIVQKDTEGASFYVKKDGEMSEIKIFA